MMESLSIGDSVTDRLVKQLTEDYESIQLTLDYYQSERSTTVKAQNLALAAYDAEIKEIEATMFPEQSHNEPMVQHIDHNILRHLNIEKDSEQYKRFEYPNPLGLSEKLQKNIEDLQTMPANHEVRPPPNLEEKAHIREKMFSFLDESRMEETRLELEYDQAKAKGEHKLAEEIAEALFILQKANCENLSDIINSYRPAAFSKVWGNDAEYNEMVKQFGAAMEDAGEEVVPPKLGKGRKLKKGH